MYRSNALTAVLVGSLLAMACSSDSPTGPATEHTPGDGSVDNGDGTTTNTVAGVDFQTTTPDFSGEPVVTDTLMVSATAEDTWDYPSPLSHFRISGDLMIGHLEESSFDHLLVVHDLSQGNAEVSRHVPDFYIGGFEYNGAIMTVEGGEDVDFYRVENGVIGDHFFQIKGFQGSKFLSDTFLDADKGYVYDSDKVWVFPLADTKNVRTAFAVPSFSRLSFSSDEKYLYVGVGDFSDSSVRIYDKGDYTLVHEISLSGQRSNGIAVDANYIYVSDESGGAVNVFNKHTYAGVGSISMTQPGALDIVGDLLYAVEKDDNSLRSYRVSFN